MSISVEQKFEIDAVYVGWPKCGSTWIFKFLQAQVDVAVPIQKSTDFFEVHHERGESWFAQQFRDPTLVCVDISHDCIFSGAALNRIGTASSPIKILVGLRNPYEWIISEFAYVTGTGRVDCSFSQFLENYPYALDHAKYEKHLRQLLNVVDRSQVTWLLLEDLRDDPSRYAERLVEALGAGVVAPSGFMVEEKVNVALKARSPFLLSVLRAGAKVMARVGLSRKVEAFKRGSLRKYIFRAADDVARDEFFGDLQVHRTQFIRTRDEVSKLMGRDLSQVWKTGF
ncbi:hypothetical protein BKA08_001816 [Nocardioides marinisabuli]|uniref:Sulfotransferase domain-containing protein n=1 Tax=Nocardioides marinisabuli TaxID=419476 RepID=A0A7Y9JRH8_9ACTN|nr:sulfotransferase domain-containing protein [Nocardioides marinisabuli]NYD57578.1 hypothetical protein [Nocardioides marinisabuli]